jgi:hypothetical protein
MRLLKGEGVRGIKPFAFLSAPNDNNFDRRWTIFKAINNFDDFYCQTELAGYFFLSNVLTKIQCNDINPHCQSLFWSIWSSFPANFPETLPI